MAHAFGMTVAAWSILGTGLLTGKFNRPGDEPIRIKRDSLSREQLNLGEIVAAEIGRSPAQVAINWVRQQQRRASIVSILGARTEQQLRDNLASLEFELGDEHLKRLEAASEIKLGFPHGFGRQYLFGGTEELIDNHRR